MQLGILLVKRKHRPWLLQLRNRHEDPLTSGAERIKIWTFKERK